MPCSYWICGLSNSGMAVCTIEKLTDKKVRLTTDEHQGSVKGLEVRIASGLETLEKLKKGEQDYGLVIVSCVNVIDRQYLRNGVDMAKLIERVDLSKLEVTAFLSFMYEPKVPMPPEVALWYFNTRFKNFVNKTPIGRKKELLDEYEKDENMNMESPSAPKKDRKKEDMKKPPDLYA